MRPSLFLILPAAVALQTCKLTPSDSAWPSMRELAALNSSIGGALLQTRPAASSCYICTEETPFIHLLNVKPSTLVGLNRHSTLRCPSLSPLPFMSTIPACHPTLRGTMPRRDVPLGVPKLCGKCYE